MAPLQLLENRFYQKSIYCCFENRLNRRNLRKLLETLTRATRAVIRRMPGFISANFPLSLDGTRVANYAQWRSKEDLDAMLRSPDARPHLDETLKIAKPDASLYKVAAIESHED